MIITRQDIIKKITAWIFLGAFCLNFIGASLFVHTHIINGVRIVHSHFYDGDGTADAPFHTHSEREITLIHHLSSLDFIYHQVAMHVPHMWDSYIEKLCCGLDIFYNQIYLSHSGLRGPPQF
ncbi:MAG: hypothetical protein II285_00975 [Flavobacteriales bacterium]|jgi:hypothetical protein|nr:hypothetical protein [Flavobacteriales bacterium]